MLAIRHSVVSSFMLAVLFVARAAWALPYLDASSPQEAFSMIAIEIRVIDEQRKYCNREIPEKKRIFDSFAFQWKLKNKEEVGAIDVYLGREDVTIFNRIVEEGLSAAMQLIVVVGALNKDAMCTTFATDLKNGERDVSQRTPRASAFLKDYLQQHPLSERQQEMRDFTSGCIAGGINRGSDYDSLRTYCPCFTNVYYNRMSDTERTEFSKVPRADLARQPKWKNIMSLMLQCKSVPAP